MAMQRIDLASTLRTSITDPMRVLAITVSALSLFALLQRVLQFSLNDINWAILQAYSVIVRFPLIYLFDAVAVRLSPSWADALVVYSLVGAVSVRTLYLIHDPVRGIVALKGSWGAIARATLLRVLPLSRVTAGWGKWVYQFASAYLWPFIFQSYFYSDRFVWIRYLDAGQHPDFNGEIGRVTSPERRAGLAYPDAQEMTPMAAYDMGTDTWYILSGDLRVLFGANLMLIAAFVGVLAAVNLL